MSCYVRFNLREPDFASCERRLREGGLAPELITRETTEYFRLDSPPEVVVHGLITVEGTQFEFDWFSGEPTRLEVCPFSEHTSSSSAAAMLAALARAFPDFPMRSEPRPVPSRWEFLRDQIAVVSVLLLVVAVLGFSVYGFISFFRRL